MNSVDFSTYKFRCSGLKHLMTNPKTKAAQEAGELAETTKTYLRDIYIQEVYGRSKPEINTGATLKGTMVESDSLELIDQATGERYFKNQTHFENDFIKGTPDVITKDRIIDTKSNWDIWTFAAVTEKSARDSYYCQLLGYMWLKDLKLGELRFCLVNTPEELIQKELYKLSWSIPVLNGSGPEAEEASNELRKNFIYDDIEPKTRIKKFTFDRDDIAIEELKSKVIRAREYLKGLSL